ncbi:DNA-binding transcriptional activator of the SARP family [Lentzea xinjiangensis]|uniref:DNA-binding transcriptional activator of the SARP family n=1 Tax=Lentzea xinjiangensis TaxID=402600 RepID=A0A1H9BJN5_9PSEU|nr:AfsR/SARP family transcriptional regulator [Lentzea xinjiangensis]SEP88823.1 DNA-binding transcriptional activator of the SARP family [Lentzea xinjiangensis]
MRAEYRVLGPLEVLLDGETVPVPAGRCHVLLAALLLRPNRLVPVDELVDRVWDGEPPTADRAHKTLQQLVRRLRVALGDADCVRTRPGGYQAAVEPDQLDLLRFRAFVGSGDFGAASALWRGPVLGNVPSDRLHREDVPQLVNERLTVLERRIDGDLDRGLAGELVAELRSLVADHPLRESFWGHLVLALHRSGQRAEALAAYREVREKLADELGVDPCPALQRLHRQVLHAEVPRGSRRRLPRQLPAGVRNFVSRHEELRFLQEAAGVTVVHGVGGVGKTALVLRWARAARERFPDGDLYVNLRGFDPEAQPVDPAAAAEMLLVGLGVDDVPATAEVRFALLRSTLVDRRLLLVLDNAASSRQVLPLLPGAAGVRVVITSRNQLRALVSQHDATAIGLRQLDPEAARSLLAAVLGADRLDAEPEAAREIAERCAGLPLALRVFAERVSRFPGTSLREFVAELVGARLDALSDFDDVDVRTVFSWSYRALDEEAARMFRLLSVHPGPDFDVTAAAALAGVPVARARRLLERLVADHLVQSRTPGRYDLHDLLRAYAAELCGDDEAAALRLTEWQVHTLENARALERGQIVVHADAITSGVVPQEFTARFDAIAWVRQEWDNLRAVLHMALGRGWGRLAMMIPTHLDMFTVFNRSRRSEAVEMYEAVQQFGTAREQGIRLFKVAGLYTDVGRFDDALACFAGALSFAREAGERDTEAAALINQALLHTALNRPADALDSARRAAGISAEMGDRYLESAARANISFYLNRLGRYEEALEEAERAAVLVAELDDDYLTARVWALQGRALATLGRFGEAADRLSAAAEVMVRFGDADNEAVALEHLGIALAGLGRRGEASAAWRRAIGLWRDRDDPEAEQHAARVAGLEREKGS